jgi:hypothetical protein
MFQSYPGPAMLIGADTNHSSMLCVLANYPDTHLYLSSTALAALS